MNGKYQVGSGRVVTFTHDTPFIDNSITEKSEIVNSENKNPKFYLKQTDSNGNELSPEQIEFFKDSKVRDENGNLLVVYHGSKADVAEYIIKNSIVESTYKDSDYDHYADVYNVLHSYLQKFNLDHIKTEIETKYGKKELQGGNQKRAQECS